MKYFDREKIQKIFNKFHFSFFYFLFIDDFDVHRNNYRFLKAFYLTLKILFYQKRRKIVNVFTLILESHDIKSDNVIAFIIKLIQRMNNDVDMIINEKIVFIYAFELTLIDNMSQQINNNEFFHHFARKKCQLCYYLKIKRKNFEYNMIVDEKYYREMINQKKYINNLTNKNKNTYLQKIKIKKNFLSIARLVSALNFIFFKIYNAFHFE